MKKLKIKSPFNIFILILFIVSLIYTTQAINKTPHSLYNKNTKEITGTITNCLKKENSYQITVKAKEKLLINYYNNFTCTLGTKIKAKGTLKKPETNTIFNLFNYQKYLYSQNINYQMTATDIKIINKNPSKLYKIKNDLTNHINTYKSKEYLNAFILGNTKEIDKEIIESYRINGISHLLAISGMHITLISTIILYILNHISKLKKINYLLVIMILIFYMFLTNFTPSVIRATLLFIAITVKKTFKLKTENIYYLILICSLYLLYNPYIIYNVGFQFSFIITAFLILSSDYLKTKKQYLKKIFIISLISFIASLPILINNFFEINLLSPIINIIFVPLVSLIIYPLSLLSLLIKPLDNILINLINIMENISLIISKITIFKLSLKHLSLPSFITYYLFITYAVNKLINNRIKPIILLIIILICHHNINYLNNNTYLTMINVGQGDSILITLPQNKGNILIDTGGQISFKGKPYDIVKNKTIPYLKSEGINKLDYLILTHGDFDHAGFATTFIDNFKVNNIILNSNEDNTLEKNIIKKAKKHKIKYQKINEKTLTINKYHFKILKSPKTADENNDSLVIYTKINNQNILLMGDAEQEKEEYILNKYNLPNIDILKVGHHGSKTSSSKEFINEISPKYSLISVGKNNIYGHPNKETLDNLNKSKIYRTDIDGSIMFKIKTNQLQIKTCIP